MIFYLVKLVFAMIKLIKNGMVFNLRAIILNGEYNEK